jgi:hypothetical protein
MSCVNGTTVGVHDERGRDVGEPFHGPGWNETPAMRPELLPRHRVHVDRNAVRAMVTTEAPALPPRAISTCRHQTCNNWRQRGPAIVREIPRK